MKRLKDTLKNVEKFGTPNEAGEIRCAKCSKHHSQGINKCPHCGLQYITEETDMYVNIHDPEVGRRLRIEAWIASKKKK